MIEFTPQDYLPMEQFDRRWLFFSREPWSPEDVAQIRPLRPGSAGPKLDRFWEYVVKWGGALVTEKFPTAPITLKLEAHSDENTDKETYSPDPAIWLAALGIDDQIIVYVSWGDDDDCAQIPWGLVRKYWFDFALHCDVLFIPESSDWLLYWFHHDEFHFGRLVSD